MPFGVCPSLPRRRLALPILGSRSIRNRAVAQVLQGCSETSGKTPLNWGRFGIYKNIPLNPRDCRQTTLVPSFIISYSGKLEDARHTKTAGLIFHFIRFGEAVSTDVIPCNTLKISSYAGYSSKFLLYIYDLSRANFMVQFLSWKDPLVVFPFYSTFIDNESEISLFSASISRNSLFF